MGEWIRHQQRDKMPPLKLVTTAAGGNYVVVLVMDVH